MSTITRERVQWLHDAATEFLDTKLKMTMKPEEIIQLTTALLASLEAEAVGEFYYEKQGGWYQISEGDKVPDNRRIKLYTAPPALVSVPDEMTSKQASRSYCGEVRGYRDGWNACRAAMLQGAESAESRCTIQTAPALDFSPKNAESRCSNSSVITDGWVACSERMPEVGVKVLCFPVNDEPIHATYNGQLWLQDISWSTSDEPIDNVISCNVFHWMPLPAAPQQVCKHEFVYGWHSYGSKSGYQCRFCGKLQEVKS